MDNLASPVVMAVKVSDMNVSVLVLLAWVPGALSLVFLGPDLLLLGQACFLCVWLPPVLLGWIVVPLPPLTQILRLTPI